MVKNTEVVYYWQTVGLIPAKFKIFCEKVIIMNAAIYIRVSTLEQSEHGYSVPEQQERLEAYCKAKDWNIAGIYIDGGYSGSNLDRPQLQKMILDIKKFNAVIIYKLDRLSRSQKDTLSLIEDVLMKNNVDIISLQENLDTSSPFGRAAIGILSAFAQLERETFKERSKLGRTGRARNGKWIGTSRPPIGYDYDVNKQELIINEYEAEQVRKIFELYLNGTGLQKIAEIMHNTGFKHKYGDWSFWGGIITIIKNTVYIGKVKFGGNEFDGAHKPIIDIETFNTAQAMLSQRQTGQLYKRHSPFSHLLECANCGAKMFYLHKKGRTPKYYCYSRYGKPIYQIKDKNCKEKIWPVHEVDSEILRQISKLPTSKQIKSINKSNKANVKELQKKIININKQINKLIELYQYSDDISPEKIDQKIKMLNKEKSSIEEVIFNNAEKEQTADEIFETANIITTNWNDLEIIKQSELVNRLINKITVSNTGIKIQWTFDLVSDD